jgi:hypothetical protein
VRYGPEHERRTRRLRSRAQRAWWLIGGRLRRLTPAPTFRFQGEEYRYLRHDYNCTWRNERAVEVPIVHRAVERIGDGRVLEVGNVLGHYFPIRHEVLDKFERSVGVINTDLLDHRPAEPYDLVVSISTLEHVGWDEEVRDPDKIPRAVEHIRGLLARAGRALVTVPLGYNLDLDKRLAAGTVGFDHNRYLKRTGRMRWEEVDRLRPGDVRFDAPFFRANGLVIGVIEPAYGAVSREDYLTGRRVRTGVDDDDHATRREGAASAQGPRQGARPHRPGTGQELSGGEGSRGRLPHGQEVRSAATAGCARARCRSMRSASRFTAQKAVTA